MADYIFPVLGATLGDITSGVGPRRSPGGIGSTNHKGIDIRGPIGTPIVAPIGGTIVSSTWVKGYGNQTVLKGDDGITWNFNHMKGAGLKAGTRVSVGSQIGLIGMTGNTTGPHTHTEAYIGSGKNKKILDPKKLLSSAKSQAKGVLDNAKEDLGKFAVAMAQSGGNPAVAAAMVAKDEIFGSSESWLDQLKRWITETGFFQRIALGVLSVIVLVAAFGLMKGGTVLEMAKRIK